MGVSKSAASRRFVGLSAGRLADFMAADLSALDLTGGPNRRAASRRRSRAGHRDRRRRRSNKHPLPLVEGATENAETVQALLDNLVSRGLDPTVPRLLSVVEGDPPHLWFGRRDPAPPDLRKIMERLPKEHHAATRRVLRQPGSSMRPKRLKN